MAKDQVHKTLKRVVKHLNKAKIPYAVLGGMALSAHRYRRATTDVDVLLTAEGLDAFRRKYLDKLHPSVRQDFIECLEEKRREDEYEAQG